ncbi:MAG TPA: response regulator transcription factor [Candidatus Obscuribacter sp.]|nr:response regulator transcription factor [Candidatus Obscuribacter sp.]HNH75652.1 response regulator transcription factor [Candidatus Obscuribacter sp.]
MPKILIVEDELHLAESVREWLFLEGHLVQVAQDSKEAERRLEESTFDVILLDILLPGASGLELCRNYRSRGGTARILITSAKGKTSDVEAGLDAGADDYIIKPFDLKVLTARIRALMRRSISVIGNQLVLGDLVVDPISHQVWRAEQNVRLLPQEFALLELLIRSPGKIYSADQLIQLLWHGKATVHTVRTHIKNVRRKIDIAGCKPLLATLHGIGYVLTTEATGPSGAER